MVIIKCNMFLKKTDLEKYRENFKKQKEEGIILIPPYFAAEIVDDNTIIKFEDEQL